MASAVADLETGLQAMLNLKPPGVSGSRITSLTSLCLSNIQSESVLIQKIFTHFKKAPGTHKLGVLYVVDSVTRKWLEQAKAQGQGVTKSAPDGTYGAGVNRVTELMPVLMNDIVQSAPEEHKEKIKKLLDIWEKGQTFPAPMLESFKEKINAPPAPNASTTPPGSPPANIAASLGAKTSSAAPPAQNSQSILDALANIARQNTSAPASNPSLPAPTSSFNLASALSGLSQPASSSLPPSQPPQAASYPANSQPAVNMPASLPFSIPQMINQAAPPASNFPNVAGANGAAAPGGALDPNTQQQILLIKALADQGIPFDKIPALIQSMTGASIAGAPAPQVPQAPGSAQMPSYIPGQAWGGAAPKPEPSRDWYGSENTRSPKFEKRSRSRSPDRGWGNRGSPRNGRDRPDYGHNSPSRGRDDDRNARRGDYRARSPPRRRGQSPPPAEKWTDFDPKLPSGSIKVLSRTLFVGGVTCSEQELRNIFSRFGTVQTCIVNKDKRHAFVKMLTRKDALSAKENTEENRNLDIPLRTRWGVGFGPRDCSDYSTGISVIPIHRLTEADRKWMLTAPHGGSGGQPIATGLVVEEPDIEIGAGVSSKAISRRMQTDKGGANGPKSTRNREDNNSGWSRGRDRDSDNMGQRGGQGGEEDQQQPMIQGFPFGIGTLPNGMPHFPAGFSFPDPSNNGQGKWA